MPVLVKDGNHFDTFHSQGEVYRIGKSLEQTAPDARLDFWKLKRISPHTRQDVVHLIKKQNPQARLLVLVPACRVSDIKLGLRPKNEGCDHSWDFRRLSWSRISSRTSSQGRPSEGLACCSAIR